MRSTRHVAIDLGASSGRVVVGDVSPQALRMSEVHRFPNRSVRLPDGIYWDVLALYSGALDGMAAAARQSEEVASFGVDSWAIDYGLLDGAGTLLGHPRSHRDPRTDGVLGLVHARLPPPQLYARNGLQFLPFTTLYQLAADAAGPHLAAATTMLLLPDLLNFWLTGNQSAELTNASTTGLLDVHTRQWSGELCSAAGIPPALLPSLRPAGEVVGRLRPEVAEETGLPGAVVHTVGSHDTASAVVAVPMSPDSAAYVSLGTWGLVGVELEAPVLTEESRAANFTNELGVDGRTRYLRNVMGLWLLQESMRVWRASGTDTPLPDLLAAAAAVPAGGPLVDVDDPRLLAPGDLPARLRSLVAEADQPVPTDPVRLVRCILDSLAWAFAAAVADACRLSGVDVQVVHVVGGGSQNSLLCQLTADACGLPVLAGPAEATAAGNLLVQARTHGTVRGDLEVLRALVQRSCSPQRFNPRT